jgi:hypothetical protein
MEARSFGDKAEAASVRCRRQLLPMPTRRVELPVPDAKVARIVEHARERPDLASIVVIIGQVHAVFQIVLFLSPHLPLVWLFG